MVPSFKKVSGAWLMNAQTSMNRMPAIVFDVLVPDDAANEVGEAFTRATEILVKKGYLTSGNVEAKPSPQIPEDIIAELHQVYEKDHGTELENASMQRYILTVEGEGVSYNELAMSFSRILTKRAELPADPIAMERQLDFELPAAYPWLVDIRR